MSDKLEGSYKGIKFKFSKYEPWCVKDNILIFTYPYISSVDISNIPDLVNGLMNFFNINFIHFKANRRLMSYMSRDWYDKNKIKLCMQLTGIDDLYRMER